VCYLWEDVEGGEVMYSLFPEIYEAASDYADQYFGFADWLPDCSKEDVIKLMVKFSVKRAEERSM
jgi:hypothetical protein